MAQYKIHLSYGYDDDVTNFTVCGRQIQPRRHRNVVGIHGIENVTCNSCRKFLVTRLSKWSLEKNPTNSIFTPWLQEFLGPPLAEEVMMEIQTMPSILYAIFDFMRVHMHNTEGIGSRDGSYIFINKPELLTLFTRITQRIATSGYLEYQLEATTTGFLAMVWHDKKLINIEHHDAEGDFLGYPTCCIEAWTKNIGDGYRDEGRVMEYWNQNVTYGDEMFVIQDEQIDLFHRIFGYTGFIPCSNSCGHALSEYRAGKEIWDKLFTVPLKASPR